jgi:CTP:molybdopterin cytidylyltransferase MocA
VRSGGLGKRDGFRLLVAPMWKGKHIAVVVPAYREAARIGRTLAGVPAFVDAIYVVDDASGDATLEAARAAGDARLVCLCHARNRGVGAAIVSGYRHAFAAGADVCAVMAGDAQMDPRDLEAVIAWVALGAADYVKGNRFLHPERRAMPVARRLGSRFLSAVTRLMSGLDVDDCQCGYTALGAAAARALPLGELWPRYGYPNDLLCMLAARKMRVMEVPVRPVYAGEESGVRAHHVALIVGLVLGRTLGERRRAASIAERPLHQHLGEAQRVFEVEAGVELGSAELTR